MKLVVGYAAGSQRTISELCKSESKDMNAGVVVNPLDALKGKVAGVNIQKTEVTQPGALFVYAEQFSFRG